MPVKSKGTATILHPPLSKNEHTVFIRARMNNTHRYYSLNHISGDVVYGIRRDSPEKESNK